jgi:hypothetical protein
MWLEFMSLFLAFTIFVILNFVRSLHSLDKIRIVKSRNQHRESENVTPETSGSCIRSPSPGNATVYDDVPPSNKLSKENRVNALGSAGTATTDLIRSMTGAGRGIKIETSNLQPRRRLVERKLTKKLWILVLGSPDQPISAFKKQLVMRRSSSSWS